MYTLAAITGDFIFELGSNIDPIFQICLSKLSLFSLSLEPRVIYWLIDPRESVHVQAVPSIALFILCAHNRR